jgi:dTDP-4-amino-4,6-dideoxygalactose transaminase
MKFNDLNAQYLALKSEIDAGISAVLSHGRFIQGPEVALLEQELASFASVKHCVACANGTDALQAVFMAYGIGPGDAVFCPDATFVASVEPAYMLGATPVFCDIEMSGYNICPESLERQIKAVLAEGKLVPKAVVAVDLFGNPAAVDSICNISAKYGIIVIEDAAQSFGASFNGKRCGSFGDIGTTSFFPSKPLGCYGDGGAVFTDDDDMAALLRSICTHGKGPKGKYDNIRVGINSRLDTLQAAILLPKLKALGAYELDRRQEVAARYSKAFGPPLGAPAIREGAVSAWAQYSLLAEDAAQRDRIIARLNELDIPSMVFYPAPQHALKVYSALDSYGEAFTNATDFCSRVFSLPMHPYMTEQETSHVTAAVMESCIDS